MDAVAVWQERILAAVANRGALAIRGSGSKDFYGEAIHGDPLDTSNYAGIVDYEPNELVVTARAGTTLDEMERTLATSNQMLAFEPPHFGARGTLGGAIATGLSGPRRPYAGAARDLVLGMRIVDGRGDDLTFGGRVMKNVAGFDVTRLMTGALGTLGVIAEVSLKCLPLPRQEATRVFELSADEAIRRVNEWGGQPLALSATAFVQGKLFVRWSGATPAVEAAIARLGGEAIDDGRAFWRSIRDHTHAFFDQARKPEHVLWRLSVKSTAPYTDLGGHQLIEWGGALRWLVTTPSNEAETLRACAQLHGGHATLFYATDKSQGVFHPLAPAMEAIQRRLKAEFDPHRVLNPGRMIATF